MTSIWKLIYELEYWIQIGTGDDIVSCPDNRPEYSHLVAQLLDQKVPKDKIPSKALILLKHEAEGPIWDSPTFWHLVHLEFQKFGRWLMFWRR